MRALLMRSLCSLFLLLATSLSWSLDPDRHISQYGHTAWRIQDELFGGTARSITQTTDGYIWIGTEAGLFRFDGVRFVSWSSQEGEQLPSTSITALLGARDGSLWIGTDAGLVHQVNGHLLNYRNGSGFISSILEDVDGEIWITRIRIGDNTEPFCNVIDTGVRCYGKEDGVPAFNAGPLVQDAAGNLWIGGDTTLLRWRPGSLDTYKLKALKANAGVDGVEAMTVAADGSLWVGMALTGRNAGLQHLVDGTLKSFVAPNLDGETLEVMALLEDHQKNLWVGTTHQGIYRIHGSDVDHYRSTDGLSSDSIFTFYEDREGNLWVATAKGLDCFRDLRVSSFSTREGLSADAVDSVLASQDGTIWVGNTSNLVVLSPGGVPSQAGKALHGHQVTSLLEDHAGRLWAGIDNTLSIYQGRKFSQVRRQDGSPIGVVIGMTEDSENNIWAETLGPPGTLIRIRDLKVREEFPSPPMPLARKIVADPQSGVWLGLVNGDLARYRSGKTEKFSFPQHPESRVTELIAASDGSILGATAFGVVGWKNGQQQVLTVRNGLPCNNIHALISDKQGDLWLHAQCGLIQIANAEVQRSWKQPDSKLQLRVFDASDGVQPGQGHFNASARSPDGRLWFANGSVLQMIDPAHVARSVVAPPIHINAVIADGKSYSPQEKLSLPPLVRDLEIDYTALSFVVPQKVLFRYMLEDHDAGWQEAGTRRQAFYSNLRPGPYHFRVIACNNDGVWNEEGATLAFSLAAAWYQTWWFRGGCLAAFLALLWALYQLRIQQLQRQEKQLRDVIDTVPTLAFSTSPDGTSEWVNRRWVEYSGLSVEATSGAGWRSTVHPDDLDEHVKKWQRSNASGEPFENEARHRSANGEYRWFLVRAVPLRDAHGNILKWYGTLTDVEDRKKAEQERERLRQLEADLAHVNRVSTMGELAASLSHELRQPIAAAITDAQTCLRWLAREQPDMEEAREATMRVVKDGNRAAEIIERLRSFYKKGAPLGRELVGLNEVIREMMLLLHSEATQFAVLVRTQLAADLPQVMGDRVQLQQVLMNLMMNSIDAMKDVNGTRELTIKSQCGDGEVLISISDTGVGLPPQQADQIFNAFFTTKVHGTGMGLRISRTIVESHGGRLWASENLPRGASFHLTLPTKVEAQE